MKLDIFNYSLPQIHIAQDPKVKRSDSKLLVIKRDSNELIDEKFINIDKYISNKDILVVNDTKVIPARIFGNRKNTNGKVELFIERILNENSFTCQIKSTRKLYKGDIIIVAKKIELKITENSNLLCKVSVKDYTVDKLISKYGEIPLPPYINRKPEDFDKEYYQTIFAKNKGSVAAPTAALHFDKKIIKKLKEKKVNICNVTLHIGMGTFSTIKENDINNHKMHSEMYSISKKTINSIKRCKENKGNVICVGTTSARALESFYTYKHEPDKFYETNIFIKPGYDFKIVDHLITNFHLPQSSLLIMIAAFYDIKNILKAYNHAIENNYKFFSYGDSTLIL